MKIFKEEELENVIFQFLERIDPFDYQKFTFSECINFFSSEFISDKDMNGDEKEISILEKVCYQDNQNRNGNNVINNNENNENYNKIIELGIDSNNNINEENENNNETNNNNN